MWKPFRLNPPKTEASTNTVWNEISSGMITSAGQYITNNNALEISALYDCIRVISEDLAKLPLMVLQDVNGIKEKRKDHSLYSVLNWQPNPNMSAMDFRTSIVSHAVGWGNGYAEKVRDDAGNVIQLWLLPPDRVEPKKDKDNLLYYEFIQDNGMPLAIPKEKIFHLAGFGFDGIKGYNPVRIARESLGLAKAAQDFGSKFFGNGAKTSMALTFPNKLSETAYNNLKRSTEQEISGKNQHRILLVEEGGKPEMLGINQKDSQYLETREFSVVEICRWFRIPPHKIGDLTRATFSNIENQNIDYVVDTLMPWFTRFEQSARNQLLTQQDQVAGYYVKHNANALLRGDSVARSNFYKNGIQDGWLVRNEVRELEDMNPIDGLDEPLVPMNMAPAGQDNDAVIDDIAERITSAEIRGLSARADKALEDRYRFNEWLNEFYGKHETYISKCIKPLGLSEKIVNVIAVEGLCDVGMSENPAEYIRTWNRKQEIINIINKGLKCTLKS